MSGGTIKQANKRFNSTGHDYEITLRTDSEVSFLLSDRTYLTIFFMIAISLEGDHAKFLHTFINSLIGS